MASQTALHWRIVESWGRPQTRPSPYSDCTCAGRHADAFDLACLARRAHTRQRGHGCASAQHSLAKEGLDRRGSPTSPVLVGHHVHASSRRREPTYSLSSKTLLLLELTYYWRRNERLFCVTVCARWDEVVMKRWERCSAASFFHSRRIHLHLIGYDGRAAVAAARCLLLVLLPGVGEGAGCCNRRASRPTHVGDRFRDGAGA